MAITYRKLPALSEQDKQRFFAKIDRTPGHGPKGECWPWIGSHHRRGYGWFKAKRLNLIASRVAYFLAYGVDPDQLDVCHTCDNPICCNPADLFLGTTQDNKDDCRAKGRHAHGDTHPSRLYPEKRPRGDNHWARTEPDKLARGSHHGNAKLTEADVIEIRLLLKAGNLTQDEIANQFGVRSSIISHIATRRAWKHVP